MKIKAHEMKWAGDWGYTDDADYVDPAGVLEYLVRELEKELLCHPLTVAVQETMQDEYSEA